MSVRGRRISGAIVESSQDAIIGHSIDGMIISWNAGARRVFGYSAREIIGQSVSRLTQPRDCEELRSALQRVLRGRRPIVQLDIGAITKDGHHIEISVSVSPVLDRHGRIIAASTIACECTERRRAEDRKSLLVSELNHRIKNILMIINIMMRQTARATHSTQEFANAIEQRIQALSRVHSLSIDDSSEGVEIRKIVQCELTPYALETRRFRIRGPRVDLTARAAQALAQVEQLAPHFGDFSLSRSSPIRYLGRQWS